MAFHVDPTAASSFAVVWVVTHVHRQVKGARGPLARSLGFRAHVHSLHGGSVVLRNQSTCVPASLFAILSLVVAGTGIVGRKACTLPLRPMRKALGVGIGFEKSSKAGTEGFVEDLVETC